MVHMHSPVNKKYGSVQRRPTGVPLEKTRKDFSF